MSNNQWLKELRALKSLSQESLGKMAGVSQDMISKIEKGDRLPSVKVAKKISEVVGIDWTKFFDDE